MKMKLKKLKKEISNIKYLLCDKEYENLYFRDIITSKNLVRLTYDIYDAQQFKTLALAKFFIKKHNLKNFKVLMKYF